VQALAGTELHRNRLKPMAVAYGEELGRRLSLILDHVQLHLIAEHDPGLSAPRACHSGSSNAFSMVVK